MAKCFLPTSASSLSHSRKPPSGVPLKYLCHVELLWLGLMPLMHPRWMDGLERKRSGYNEGLKAEVCFYRSNSHEIKMLFRRTCATSVKTSGMPTQKSNRRKSLLHAWPALLTHSLTSSAVLGLLAPKLTGSILDIDPGFKGLLQVTGTFLESRPDKVSGTSLTTGDTVRRWAGVWWSCRGATISHQVDWGFIWTKTYSIIMLSFCAS